MIVTGINSEINTHIVVMCANVFVREGDRVLLLKRSEQKEILPGYYHPIGGKVDPNEEPLQAARRELLEEAGIAIRNIRLEAVVTEIEPHRSDENWLIFHFSGEYDGGDIQETQEGEFVWLSKDEIFSLKEKLFPSVRAVIDHILDDSQGPVFASFLYTNQEDETAKLVDLEVLVR